MMDDLSQTIELSHCSQAVDEKTSSRRWSYRKSTLDHPYDLEGNQRSSQVGHNNAFVVHSNITEGCYTHFIVLNSMSARPGFAIHVGYVLES